METLKEYIKYYDEVIDKLNSGNNRIVLEVYNLVSRRMIESMFDDYLIREKIEKMSITDFFEKQSRVLKFAWKHINYNNHFKSSDITTHNYYLNKIANFFNYRIRQIPILDLESEIEWKKIPGGKKQYQALVEKRDGSFYTVSHKDKGYKQKNKFVIKSDIPMSKGIHYKISTIHEEAWINEKNMGMVFERATKVEPIKLTNPLIDEKLKEAINEIVVKHEMSPLDFIFAFPSSLLVKKIEKIFNDDKDNSILWNVIALKYFDDEILKKNHQNSPLNFEFWTKNPRVKNLSLYEKKRLKWLLLKNKAFPKLENAEFDNRLQIEKKYFQIGEFVEDEFPDNNSFNNNYDEKKIVQMNGFYTTKGKSDILNKFYKVFKNKAIDFTLNKKIMDDNEKATLNKEQKAAISYALKNTRTVILGASGTGKTKTSAKIIESLIDAGETHMLLASRHKAKAIITEMNSEKSKDIKYKSIKQVISSDSLLDGIENIVIDEISSVNDNDWLSILSILDKSKRLILIGDEKQLPPNFSIGITKLFATKFLEINIQNLSVNMRQKELEDRKEVEHLGEFGSFINFEKYFTPFSSFSDCIKKIKSYVDKDYQIITPTHFGLLGTTALNSALGSDFDKITAGNKLIFAETIKSARILYKNLELIVESFEDGIIKFSKKWKSKYIWEEGLEKEGFSFIGKKLTYKVGVPEEFPFISAKTMTVHSAQRGTYDNVLLVMPPGYEISREMLYAAATRFKVDFKILVNNKFDLPKYSKLYKVK